MKLLIIIEQKCSFISGVATWQQLTFNESRQMLDNFYSSFFVKSSFMFSDFISTSFLGTPPSGWFSLYMPECYTLKNQVKS